MTQWGLDTLFNPAKRHMDDEKQRLQSTREEVGDNSGGRRVDLESGKVVIRKHDSDGDDHDATSGSDDALRTDTTSTATKTAAVKDPEPVTRPEPSAAAKRAAARRGRTAR